MRCCVGFLRQGHAPAGAAWRRSVGASAGNRLAQLEALRLDGLPTVVQFYKPYRGTIRGGPAGMKLG